MEENVLYLTRFCGMERYPVETATWNIIEGDGTEDAPDILCLEINFYSLKIPADSLEPGFCLEQPNQEEDVDGNLYYMEHQPTMDNKMEVIEVDGKRLKIRLTGLTEDVNYYDGSKPKNTMELVAWFDKD